MKNDFFKYILLSSGSRQNRTELETETLPYAFNSNSYKLRNYRIYGNTVDGESVGDLVTEGEHSGEYLVPVKAEGKNLLQNTTTSRTRNDVTFTVNADGSVICNGTASALSVLNLNINYQFIKKGSYILSGCPENGSDTAFCLDLYGDNIPMVRDYGQGKTLSVENDGDTATSVRLIIFSGTVCDNITFYPMIRKADITDDKYEPYHEPITTNIYLPEPLRKIGNELEYIDFREQKQHSKKNLWNIELVKGSFHTDGKPTIVQNRVRSKNNDYFLPAGTYTLNANGVDDCIVHRYRTQSTDDWVESESVVVWQSLPYTFTTSEGFYTMFGFRRSDNANIEPSDVTNIQFEKGSTATDYEAPNESVELDISLPALPTLSDTNTITFGTTVQPSKIWIQGNISEIETVSAETQALQANIQNLQPLSLDVMPIDRSEFQINDISEVPVEVEDENPVEEIPETENFETSGDEENAE